MARKSRLPFEKFDPRGIPLRELIAVQREFGGRRALADNLGDAFLYATNPIFRNIRDEYLRRGFSFSTKDTLEYFSFPLMALDEAIAAGVIPYRRNFIWLEKMEKSAPGKFTLTELKRAELKFNYLFHESAHFIAHRAFFGRKNPRSLPKNSSTILQIFLGEAYANTVEALASIFAEGEIGAYFLDANCHFRASEKEVKWMLSGAKKGSLLGVAKALFGAFLYGNFMKERLNKREAAEIRIFSGVRDPRLYKVGLMLNEEFRMSTTPLHLVKLGFSLGFPRLMQFDPVHALNRDRHLKNKVEALLALAVRGAL